MNSQRIIKNISDGIIVAAIPVAGAFAAYFYEAGYLRFFYAPVSFIQLDFPRVVKASCWILATLLIVVFYTSLLLAWTFKSKHPFRRILRPIFVMGLPIAVLAVFFQAQKSVWIALASIALLLIMIELVPPIFSKGLTYWKRVELHLQRYSLEKPSNEKIGWIDTHLIFPIFFILLAAIVCWGVGYYFASQEDYFYVMSDNPDSFIVASYGDTLLIRTVDKTTATFLEPLEVRRLENDRSIKLRRQFLGKLIPHSDFDKKTN